MQEKAYIIEFIAHGRFVKVTAIDPASGREVTMVGDPAQGQDTLKRLAVRKLEYVLNQKK